MKSLIKFLIFVAVIAAGVFGYMQYQSHKRFDFTKGRPADFVVFLEDRYVPLASTQAEYVIEVDAAGKSEIPANWLRREDIPELMPFLDRNTPSVGVRRSSSTYISTVPSSMSNEAYHLIMGFRNGTYPPLNTTAKRSSSTAANCLNNCEKYWLDGTVVANRKSEVLGWWREYTITHPVAAPHAP